MNYLISKKAWCLNLNAIEEGYLHGGFIVLAKNRNQARSKMIEEIKYESIELNKFYNSSTEITYLNVPIRRCKECDLVKFEGEELERWRVKNRIDHRLRMKELDSILEDDSVIHVYIKKRGSFYGSNFCGYTGCIEKAGVYKKEEAIKHARSCDELLIVPISTEDHNKMLAQKIDALKSKIL